MNKLSAILLALFVTACLQAQTVRLFNLHAIGAVGQPSLMVLVPDEGVYAQDLSLGRRNPLGYGLDLCDRHRVLDIRPARCNKIYCVARDGTSRR